LKKIGGTLEIIPLAPKQLRKQNWLRSTGCYQILDPLALLALGVSQTPKKQITERKG